MSFPPSNAVSRIARAIFIYVTLPLLLLALFELLLRAAGVGESGAALLPKEYKSNHFHVPSQRFYQQFTAVPLQNIVNWDYLDFVCTDERPKDTVRIFAFGESALYGTRSAPRILQAMLQEACPGLRFEVHNVSCPGMNSHVLRALAAEAAVLQPDIFLIYMGNNEAVGPYGPTTAIGKTGLLYNAPAIQGLIALNRLRTMQLLGRVLPPAAAAPTDALIQASIPGATDNARVVRLYMQNLTAMVDAARGAGAAAVVCTLAANRRFHGMEPEHRAGQPIPRGEINNALMDFVAARSDQRVVLADVEQRLYDTAESGAPDYGQFIDNIHFTFDGAYQAACAMFAGVWQALPEEVRARCPEAKPQSREEAAASMAWNEAAELDALRQQVPSSFDAYSKELLQKRLDALEAKAPADVHLEMAAACDAALRRRPQDLYLLRARFEAYLFGNHPEQAMQAAEAMVAAQPLARVSLRAIPQALAQNHQDEKAREEYGKVLALYPDDLPSKAALGLMDRQP